jgi:3'-phosphoadenosine 5'-phosphosulfate (PAPS) 3'-phosphatase
VDVLLSRLGSHELVAIGSSLNLCVVAEGSAELYPRLGATSEWDTVAAHAVVPAASGYVTSIAGAMGPTTATRSYSTRLSWSTPIAIGSGTGWS